MSAAAGTTVLTGDGRRVRLGALIKSGGAGGVYRLQDDVATVAKLYHPGVDCAQYARKVAAMLELTPDLPDLVAGGERFVQIAWPKAALYDAGKRFLGYLMPAVDVEATSELECILQEKQARSLGLPTGLGAKVTLAANLAAVIAALHRQRHCVVDLKPVNLRFYRQSLYMAMLDCDGFSIQGHGERFAAPQITPDYLAPEFHARGLTPAGENEQDRFALAVVVFQLLNFGIHPFTGRPQTDRVPTDIPARIAGRWYAYGLKPNALLLPSPTSGHAAMPVELRQLFDRAFESAGGTRPSADEWSALLRGYAQRALGRLLACRRDATHQHFVGLPCAACVRMDLLAGAKVAALQRPPRIDVARPGLPPRLPMPGRRPPWPGRGTVRPVTPMRSTAPGSTLAAQRVAAIRAAMLLGQPPPPPPPAAPFGRTWGNVIAFVAIIAFVAFRSCTAEPRHTGYDSDPTYLARQLEAAERASAEADAARADNAAAAARALAETRTQATMASASAADTPPPPDALQRAQFQDTLDELLDRTEERDGPSAGRAWRQAASRSRERDYEWRAGRARDTGSGNGRFDLGAAQRAAAAARLVGQAALERGDRLAAQDQFVLALWFDAQDPDAWMGYGMALEPNGHARAAMALGLLHYRSLGQAWARRRDTEPVLVSDLGFSTRQVETMFDEAGTLANAVSPGFGDLPLGEPFRWPPDPAGAD